MRKIKTKRLVGTNIERANKVFERMLEKFKKDRDVKGLNEDLNELLDELNRVAGYDMKSVREIDKGSTKQRDYLELSLQKGVYLACLLTGLDYLKVVKKWELEYQLIKSIALLEYLINYKMQEYGAEIFGEMGLEIVGFTEKGELLTREKENVTEKELKKRQETIDELDAEVFKEVTQIEDKKHNIIN